MTKAVESKVSTLPTNLQETARYGNKRTNLSVGNSQIWLQTGDTVNRKQQGMVTNGPTNLQETVGYGNKRTN